MASVQGTVDQGFVVWVGKCFGVFVLHLDCPFRDIWTGSFSFSILGLQVSFSSSDWVLPYRLEAFQGQPFPLPDPTQSHSGPAH